MCTRHSVKMSSLDLRHSASIGHKTVKFSVTLTGMGGAQTGQMLGVRWGGAGGVEGLIDRLMRREVHRKAPLLR